MRKYTLFIFILLFISACATQKSRSDQSKVGQFYHNLTSKYNGYFNANELVQESIAQLNEQHIDNYNKLLPVYEYAAVENADGVKNNMDEAIKKVSVVVTLHEFSDWADDCYLLIGKANYIKKDYESAENALEFYMDEFKENGKRTNVKPSKKKKKKVSPRKKNSSAKKKSKGKQSAKSSRASKQAKKERERYNKALRKAKKKGKSTDSIKKPTKKAKAKPEDKTVAKVDEAKKKEAEVSTNNNGMMGHKPAYDAATLWLARTYMERDNFIAADYHLLKLEKKSLENDVARELPVARSDYYLRRGNYEKAIGELNKAIEIANKRENKARYTYILAQVYQMLNRDSEAAMAFEKVLSMNTSYEMQFNAKLSTALNAMAGGSMSSEEAEKALEKMLKDFKNEEYKDQIYYSLAQIALKANDEKQAIEYLTLSVSSPSKNAAQKTESNHQLATLHFKRSEFVAAKQAYDATMATMSQEDERFAHTKLMSENLADIAKNLEIITEKDSLLRIAAMSEDERKDLAKVIRKEREKAQLEASMASAELKNQNKSTLKNRNRGLASPNSASFPTARTASNTTIESLFFAYNPKTLKKGEKEFEKSWGEINLQDNWRVRSLAKLNGLVDEATTEEAVTEVISENEVSDIFKNVPGTPEEIEAANGAIRKAMLALGTLYRDKLDDTDASTEILEELISRFPDAPETLEALYQLYLSYLQAGNQAKANEAKKRIIDQFPNSKFAKALSDPDYASKQLSEKQKLVNFYDATYQLFENGNIEGAKANIATVADKFGATNPMSSKFALLNAMCIGSLEGKEAYITALKELIGKFPRTDDEKKARDILLILGASGQSKVYGSKGLNEAKFLYEPDKIHFVMVYVKNQADISLKDAKIKISNYNREYHQLDKIKITSLIFNAQSKESLILLRSFKTGEKASEYQQGALRKKSEFIPAEADFVIYPITQSNYRELIKSRSIEGYAAFFEETYK